MANEEKKAGGKHNMRTKTVSLIYLRNVKSLHHKHMDNNSAVWKGTSSGLRTEGTLLFGVPQAEPAPVVYEQHLLTNRAG